MQQLGAVSGPAFGCMWLQVMIEHHAGTVQMSQIELRDGADPGERAERASTSRSPAATADPHGLTRISQDLWIGVSRDLLITTL
jgi:hypothetical protein